MRWTIEDIEGEVKPSKVSRGAGGGTGGGAGGVDNQSRIDRFRRQYRLET